ncbi:hypothetical protein ELQ90_03115 [Labedella phragmitis]|uniref:Uncharacterized protein n=1 Tax=Labedella phragmitis TaxID=2498849 RepID=A0A3S3Z6L5_9MICO|nr:hypothetical protein [Labedella phragmitis]RWZ52940.1 hypothetical protein ELQ90_03115 [Labedella phragmitis]
MAGIRVTIGGTELAQSWNASQPAALDDLYIDWGRDSVYDDVPPAKLTLRVLDPDGTWSSDPARYGERITVWYDDRCVYRGDVDEIATREATILSPDGETVHLWSTTLLAVDPLAILAKIVPTGPGPDPADAVEDREGMTEFYGPNFWRLQHPSYRVEDVYNSDARIRAAVPGGLSGGYTGTSVRSAPVPMGDTALDLIRRAYYLPGPGAPFYRPDTDRVGRGYPSTAGALALTYTGGRVVLVGAGSTDVVPAAYLEMEQRNPDLVSTFSKSINSIRFTVSRNHLERYDNNYLVEKHELTEYVAGVETIPGRLVENRLDFDAQLWYYTRDRTAPSGWSRNVPGAALDAFLTDPSTEDGATVANIRGMNGRIGLPALAANLRDPSTVEALGTAMVTTLTTPAQRNGMTWYFTGLKYAGLRYVGPMFMLIGGRFGYSDGGWYASDLKFAPAVAAPDPDPVTVASWITNVNPSFSQIDPNISFSDLEHTATGAA